MVSLCASRKNRRLASLRALKNKENKNPNMEHAHPGSSKDIETETHSIEYNTEVPASTDLVSPIISTGGSVELQSSTYSDHTYHKSTIENITTALIHVEPIPTCSTDPDIQEITDTPPDDVIINEEREMQSSTSFIYKKPIENITTALIHVEPTYMQHGS
ncbi:hypothetical protein FQR65_LT08765 [Abscondita terminalis]|nr:hypothetical protein FQR65_LT08765 [Abscondita terminalis]